jgi:hypothetical protein
MGYTLSDFQRVASERDSLEKAIEVLQQKLAETNKELDVVAEALTKHIPLAEDIVEVPPEDYVPVPAIDDYVPVPEAA